MDENKRKDHQMRFTFDVLSFIMTLISYTLLFFAKDFSFEGALFALPFIIDSLKDLTVDIDTNSAFQRKVAWGILFVSVGCVILCIVSTFVDSPELSLATKVLLTICTGKFGIGAAYHYICYRPR